MATSEPTCTNCVKSGLPILLTRYAVVPKAIAAPLPAGISGQRVIDVVLTEHQYALRTLRQGYVYIFYAQGARGSNYWEVYRVAEDGTLWHQAMPMPMISLSEPVCRRHASSAPVTVIAIDRPDECGEVFIAFSEHPWSDETFDRYKADVSLRRRRMQSLFPAKWSGSPQGGHAIKADERVLIGSVLEYMPWDTGFPLSMDACRKVSQGTNGQFRNAEVAREVTRHPLHMRSTPPALDMIQQAVSRVQPKAHVTSPAQSLIQCMNDIGKKAGGGENPPMLMALWDAVGVTHELSGFRNDPASSVKRYSDELATHVMAMTDIDKAERILKNGVVAPQERFDKANAEHFAKDFQRRATSLRAKAEAQVGEEQQRTLFEAKQYDYLASHGLYSYYAVDDGVASPAAFQAWQARQDKLIAFRQKVHDRQLAELRADAWDKYETLLDREAIARFRAQYQALQTLAYNFQEARTADVGVWLQTTLLLDALEDYHPDVLRDGIAFEYVVAEAIFGLGSTPKGLKLIDTLAANLKASSAESLLWRAVGLNMRDGLPELEQALQIAHAQKDTPLQVGAHAVVAAASNLKTLTGYYKNMAKIVDEANEGKLTPIAIYFKRQGIDKLVTSAGDSIFRQFRVDKLGDFIGEKVIQQLFLERAGVSDVDALALVKKQALLEGLSRHQTLERLRTARTFMEAEHAVGAAPATTELREAWDKIKDTDKGQSLMRTGHITVVVGLLEAVNFYKLCAAGQLDGEAKGKLIASGASLASAVITISALPYQAVLKTSVTTQAWKLAGGVLGTVAMFIGAMNNFSKTTKSGNFDKAYFYITGTIGLGSGLSVLISTLSSAAPLFKKLAARWGTEVIVFAVEELSARIAVVAALRIVGMLAGWEATLVVLAIEAIHWYFSDNDLEKWCRRCPFALLAQSKDPYNEAGEQATDFNKALAAVQ